VDGTFGVAAAVAEMFLQSHEGAISFLPALPASWGDGEARGLCARGGFEVSFNWGDGQLERAVIKSKNGSTCRIRTERGFSLSSEDSESRALRPEDGILEFETKPGLTYVLKALAFGPGETIGCLKP
jgi:alpha-L-fucosidase 2